MIKPKFEPFATADGHILAKELVPLYGLTLLQPWPYAIRELDKRIENRGWTPPAWVYDRWLALHGSKYPMGSKLQEAMADHEVLVQKHGCTVPVNRFPEIAIHGIFALVRVSHFVTEPEIGSEDPWFCGPYGWVIDDLIALPEPVTCKGAQRLWEVSGGAMDNLRKALTSGKARRWTRRPAA